MSEFQPGEIVDITIKGARVVSVGYHKRFDSAYLLTAIQINGDEAHGRIHLDGTGTTVTRVAPAEWPPQVGDLWRDVQGDLWFVIANDDDASVEMVCATGSNPYAPAYIAETYGPLELVHREAEDGADHG